MIQIVVRRSRLGRRAPDGQQPTAVGITTTLGEPWRIVGAAGRYAGVHLRLPSILPDLSGLGCGAEVDRPFHDQLQRPSAAILGKGGVGICRSGGDQGHAESVTASTASLESRRHHGGVGRLPVSVCVWVVGDAFVSLPEGACYLWT